MPLLPPLRGLQALHGQLVTELLLVHLVHAVPHGVVAHAEHGVRVCLAPVPAAVVVG